MMVSKESKHSDEDNDSSSDSSILKEDKGERKSPQAKDSVLLSKAESESPKTDSSPPQSPTPSKPSSPPSSKNSTSRPSPSPPPPSPPPPPKRSPPPPPSPSRSSSHPPPPPSSPRPSSRPPSSPPPQEQRLRLHNEDSFTPPYNQRRQPPPPPFHSPPHPDRLSTHMHGAPIKDSILGISVSGSSHLPKHDAAPTSRSRGSSSPASSGDNTGKYVGVTLAGIFAVALVALAVVFVFAFKRKRAKEYAYSPYMQPINIHLKPGANRHYYEQQLGNGMKHIALPVDSPQPKNAQILFTYEMVVEITNAFSSQNVIGEGGFGFVYKGWLPDGRIVAVKQLKAGSGQGEREFKSEVEIISRVHHRHLVSLVGYCIFEQQRILIYEFVPNGTLHQHLHGIGMQVLDWTKRLKIAIGAAKGLAYLHEDCSQKIIHRDIKSANILLDDAFEAQVADFGLARLADAANTHVSTRVMGTFGYMAPEYATSGKLTDRSDVFSFGVVLLELVTGRKPVDQTKPLGEESLVEWARPLLHHAIETRDFSELIDPRLEKNFVESEMLRMIEAAAACVRHSAPRRPRMVQVVRALDFEDKSSDLSNGVKYGHSTVYDSGHIDKEIMLFRRMVNGTFVDSDFDMDSGEYNLSRETSRGSQQELMRHSSSGESECRAIHMHRSSID